MQDWTNTEKADRAQEVCDLNDAERAELTWEEAARYVPSDAASLSIWRGELERKSRTPFAAICRVLDVPLPEDER